MSVEAKVTVFNKQGKLVTRIIKGKTLEAVNKKLDTLEEAGNLREVLGWNTDN